MKIIEPGFSLHTPFGPLTAEDGVKLLRWVEYNARISHRSEDKQTEDSWRRFIQAVVIEHGDWSVTEHASFTAEIRTDRGITHEIVRHRLFSFTQESTRFVNYTKKGQLEFIRPIELSEGQAGSWSWEQAIRSAEEEYLSMVCADGVRPQEARSVLPNALAATITVTGNLRNWRLFFLMRTSKETHPDFRRISIPMLLEAQRLIPMLYDDIEPMQRQIDNLRKPR